MQWQLPETITSMRCQTGRAAVLSSPTAITIESVVQNVRTYAARLPEPSAEASYIAVLERDFSLEMFELRSEVLQTITEHEDAVRRLAETLLSEKHRQVLEAADRAKKRE